MPETDSNRPAKLAGRLPAFWFSLLLAAGIAAGRVLGCSSRLTLSIFSILFLLYLLTSPFSSKDRFQFRTVILCFLLASGGMAAISLRDRLVRSRQEILPPFGSSVALAGRVISPSWTSRDFDFGESQHFEIEISALKLPELDTWRKADFRACVTLPAGDSAGLSGFERIALAGRIEPVSGRSNPGGFDWREYQAARGVAAEVEVESREDIFTLAAPSGWDYLTSPSLLAGRIRAAVVSLHGRLYPSGEIRGVADALLAGDRNRLSAGIRKTFTASGTVHVLVVSGLHTSVVALVLFYGFSLLFGRGLPTSLITIAGLALFSLTSGGRPSVVRASLMCTLALLALPLHRVRVLFNSISSAFALSLLVRPDWLFDIGFQLSFAAVAGIGLLTPLLESRFRSRSWWQGTVRRWLVRLALASTAAQLAITPLVATYFHRVTPVSILANLAVIPLAMASVVAGLTADVLALVWLPAAEAAAALNSGLIELMLLAARFFSGFGWSAIEIPAPGAAGVVFSWLVVYLAAAWWAGRKSGGYLALTCLLWLNFQLWGGVLAGRTRTLTFRFLDAGRMEIPVAHLPGGSTLLADPAGRISGAGRSAGDVAVPYVWDQGAGRVDYLILRGRQPSLWSWAWEVLQRLEIGRVILTGSGVYGPNFQRLVKYCIGREIPVMLATSADTLNLRGFRIFFVGSGAGRPVVPVVEQEGRRFVLAGQLRPGELSRPAPDAAPLACAVVEWPGLAGRRVSAAAAGELLWLFQCETIVSAGEPGGSATFGKAGKYVTSVCGAVSFISAGEAVEVRVER